jgi:thymidylate synthase
VDLERFYKPLSERTPDRQYQDVLRYVLSHGVVADDTIQGDSAITCFGNTPKMVFDLRNGIPMITERKIGYKMPVGEILAFIHGERDIERIAEVWGCPFWNDYKGRGVEFKMEPNDLGPASYGGAFAAYPNPNGGSIDQFAQMVEQLRKFPNIRTHRIITWIPGWASPGPERRVIVAPCHGDLYFRVINEHLHMTMVQRSADLPIGVPHNMVQYAAVLLMMSQATGYKPGLYVHDLVDAHIYQSQVPYVEELIAREPRPFPRLLLKRGTDDLFAFRPSDFLLDEYEPHPAIKDIPYFP